MGHNQDFWEVLRTHLARPIGAFVTGKRCSEQHPSQFVGYVEMGEEAFEEVLHEMGYHRNPLAFWKYTVNAQEEGSWRRVEGDWQLHVTLYDHPEYENRTYIYAHWEYRWDRKPLAHLRGEGINVPKGVNEMRRDLTMANVEWLNDPSIR